MAEVRVGETDRFITGAKMGFHNDHDLSGLNSVNPVGDIPEGDPDQVYKDVEFEAGGNFSYLPGYLEREEHHLRTNHFVDAGKRGDIDGIQEAIERWETQRLELAFIRQDYKETDRLLSRDREVDDLVKTARTVFIEGMKRYQLRKQILQGVRDAIVFSHELGALGSFITGFRLAKGEVSLSQTRRYVEETIDSVRRSFR